MSGHSRFEWHTRIKTVEGEFRAARAGADLLLAALRQASPASPPGIEVADVQAMTDHLETTFFIRLFAAFEAGLRTYWAAIRNTEPPSRDLIDGIATRRGIPDSVRSPVHEVRVYRNGVIHEADEPPEVILLATARGHLQKFFSWLPESW
jgi:hypothetical protein